MFQVREKLEPWLPHTPMTRGLYLAYGFVPFPWSVCFDPCPTSAPFQAGQKTYPAGYTFPAPFGCRLSLLGASCPRWGVVPPSRLAYWLPRPHRDYHVPHAQQGAVGSVYPPVVRHLRQAPPNRLSLTTYLLVRACQPL
jgi:hypothetical protein